MPITQVQAKRLPGSRHKAGTCRHHQPCHHHGAISTSSVGAYHHQGSAWSKLSLIRPAVWVTSRASRYSGSPSSRAGTSHNANRAMPPSKASSADFAKRLPSARAAGCHQRAASIGTPRCSRATGPFASRPAPIASATPGHHGRHASPSRRHRAISPPSTATASGSSYMTCRANRKKYQKPAIAHAAFAAMPARCGYSRRASTPVWATTMPPSNTISRRGQTSLTPPTSQPAWISHGSSGVLCEYGAPLNNGTSQLPRSHISHATARLRVEYSGTGPCRKIDTSATTAQASSGRRRSRRSGVFIIGRKDTARSCRASATIRTTVH